MKIIHINYSDDSGGAAIASRRLCESMIANGIDSKLVVLRKKRDSNYIKQIGGWKQFFHRIIERFIFIVEKTIDPVATYSLMLNGLSFGSIKEIEESDIIFIHWANAGTLSINGIKQILKLSKPTYLYLHDMFYITGGCHHSFGCSNFEYSCSDCPITKNRFIIDGLSQMQLTYKIKSWAGYPNLNFIAPSSWLANLTKKSSLAKGHDVYRIPNVIDTNIYKPTGRNPELYGLDKGKFTILFGNASFDSPYKGIRYIVECLHKLDPNKFQCVIIGRDINNEFENLPIKTAFTGYLRSDMELVQAYNSCDAMIISSVAENYPNVVLEAMACGKPCIGFNVGGIPDLIIHKVTGLIASEVSSDRLLESIVYMENDTKMYEAMVKNCRRHVIENNSYSSINSIYGSIFKKTI